MKTSLIRPGILVSLKTVVAGGVSYKKVNLDATDEQAQTQAEIKRWETTRSIRDAAEHKRASQIRSAARALIVAQCARTSFALLCPENNEQSLDAVVTQAREAIDEFNSAARYTRVELFVIKGRVASSDEEAARAIASEVRDLMEEMSRSIDKLDTAAIRDAATRAKQMASMLAEDQAEKVSEAISAARAAAREIVKRVEKGGELAATVLGNLDKSPIEAARMSFLDLDTPEHTVNVEALPAVNLQRFDFDTEVAPNEMERPDESPEPVAVGA